MDEIESQIINKLFNGEIAGPFEYNDVRELANKIREEMRKKQEQAWDKAWLAFLKNNPKNPYRNQ